MEVTTVYYSVSKKLAETGEIKISFWTKDNKSDLFVELFVAVDMDRIRFRVRQKLKLNIFALQEV